MTTKIRKRNLSDLKGSTSVKTFDFNLEQEVSKALLQLPPELDKLLSHRFGLGSGIPRSIEEESLETCSLPEEIRMKEAQALRLLMGYGKRIS
ncbi:MAG: hypothetical protein GYA55_14595 [SAR324 cluster bacterium]|uniref:Uncharacterized protein n=1 Tax=SAR324 cluster bacterium TaxID=2024889 RepID=A0A7X9IL46_9DELT|nr:hypothetical protein [SAR324 cluster bacterium]